MTQNRAMLFAFGGFLAWVLVDVAIKLGAQGPHALSPFMMMAVLGTFGATNLAASTIVKGKLSLLRPCRWREQGAIAACSVCINFANIIALKHLPLTIFYIVVFTAPLVIAALSAMLKHERLKLTKILCLVAGFGGTVLAVGINEMGGDGLGYCAACIGVVSFAAYTIFMRKIGKTVTVESTQFLSALCVGAIGVVGLYVNPAAAPHLTTLTMLLVAGGINVLGNALYNTALQHTSSTNVAQLHYTQIVSGAIFGYVLWHEVPTWNLAAGSVVIIVSGMIVAAQAGNKELA